jgi:pyridoxamine 5'-phosphate oxidase
LRPRSSQISALASPQSQTVESREELERRVRDPERRYADRELPMPSSWGGFRLAAETLEFRQQRHDRLHDRLRHRREGDRWLIERLGP